ncbi:DUF2924 domain-containing protein [Humitalea sp. 24SJ18S-53]|uniref:DUF2924 domain-containing protein n=1 Tax=Humitalea sp. 24SJ18S-53 TaxID=3422307 RepID=UPI003D675466
MHYSRKGKAGDLDVQLAALDQHDVAQLRAEWQRLYRAIPAVRISRDLLIRGIAHRLQEAAMGGLSPRLQRQLASVMAANGKEGGGAIPPTTTRLKPGTTLVRAWHGQTHTIQVLPDGFEHQGQRYASLSHIAKVITGAHWSGPRFFGLGARPAPPRGGGGVAHAQSR